MSPAAALARAPWEWQTVPEGAGEVTVSDYFCGAGGSSTGAASIPGVKVKFAANHWDLAIEVHNENHQDTDHAAKDLHKEDPRYTPHTDIAWFSPECTKWSQANGKTRPAIEEGLFEDPNSDDAAVRSRLLMFDVLRFADYHRYRVMIVENVVDIAVQSKYALAWWTWRQELAKIGYKHKVISLNSMHAQLYGAPAPQSRDRIYIVCWLAGSPEPDLEKVVSPWAWCSRCETMVQSRQSWKNGKTVGRYRQSYVYVHPGCGQVVEPGFLPAAAAIDWSVPGQVIGDRLADKTRRRIAAGIARHWSPLQIEAAGNTYDAAVPQHPDYGNPDGYYRAWPTHEELRTLHTTASKGLVVPVEGRDGKDASTAATPLRTQTTRAETALVTPAGGTWNDDPTLAGAEPLRTVTTRDAYGLATMPFMAELRGGGSDARPILEPAATFCASGNHHALITRHYGVTGGDPGRHTTPAGEELRTLTGNGGNMSLLMPYYGTARDAKPATQPVGTLTTVDRYALVHRNNGGGAEMTTPAMEYMRTLTTAGHQSLIQGPPREGKPPVTVADLAAAERMVSECYFRMLMHSEVAAGMAFPDTYIWQPKGMEGKISNRNLVKMTGNAVTPPAARDLIGAVVSDWALAA